MPASAYNGLTGYDSPLMTAVRAGKSPYAGQIKEVLDDALEGSAAPEDVADLRNSRWQYKNLMTVVRAAQEPEQYRHRRGLYAGRPQYGDHAEFQESRSAGSWRSG